MRLLMPSLAILAGLGISGIHCAYADTPAAHPCSDAPAFDRYAPSSLVPHIELIDEGAQRLPTFDQSGRSYVLGNAGARYQIRITNPTASRIEAVVSVDGLDAIDGHPANLNKRGYIVSAYGDITVDGFRTSLDTVAAFRFSSVRDSYAARTGHPRNVGVVGVAFFAERSAQVPRHRLAAPEESRAAPAPAPAGAQDAEGSAPAARKSASGSGASSRLGLGTQFGETRQSQVTETAFVRASAQPSNVAELRYDDREGLVSRGIEVTPTACDPRAAENERRDRAQAFPDSRFAQPPP